MTNNQFFPGFSKYSSHIQRETAPTKVQASKSESHVSYIPIEMANPKAGYFCIYNSTAIDDDALVDSLNRGQFNNPPSEKQWSTPQVQFSGQEPSAIVAHHRQSPGILDNQYFVICDRPDWATSSVLAVNLDFQGWEDAARMEVGVAGDALPSISIANTDWEENLGASGETWPRERFAVYVTSEGTIDQEALVKVLNAGLNGRKAWTMGGGVCRDATALLPKIGGTELTALAEMHESIARGEGFDPATFVVADHADWESAGVSIVQTGGQNLDVCNKSAEYAAEILTWVHQGLYTWAEGKDWSK